METILQAMREYAQAVRGDWSTFDGRGNLAVMTLFISALRGGSEMEWMIQDWRDDLGLCQYGEGHWTEHCDAYCEQRARGV